MLPSSVNKYFLGSKEGLQRASNFFKNTWGGLDDVVKHEVLPGAGEEIVGQYVDSPKVQTFKQQSNLLKDKYLRLGYQMGQSSALRKVAAREPRIVKEAFAGAAIRSIGTKFLKSPIGSGLNKVKGNLRNKAVLKKDYTALRSRYTGKGQGAIKSRYNALKGSALGANRPFPAATFNKAEGKAFKTMGNTAKVVGAGAAGIGLGNMMYNANKKQARIPRGYYG